MTMSVESALHPVSKGQRSSVMTLEPHPLTQSPNAAWTQLSKTQKVIKIRQHLTKPDAPSDKVRIVCMSDTHSLTAHIKFPIPDGDILIHAGDFSRCGGLEDVIEFNEWIGKVPHKHKIVISGNHELSFDAMFISGCKNGTQNLSGRIPTLGFDQDEIEKAIRIGNIAQYLSNCTYLQDETIELYGSKIYGTPWQPAFLNWAFNLPRGEACLAKWDLIPADTDILITHTPPVGHGDLSCAGIRVGCLVGCVELLATVQKRVKPKYHIFGHIHEGYGITSDGKIIYINASTCDINYTPKNPPIVFDISLPPGQIKE